MFKKGDKVRCIDDGGYSSISTGATYYVQHATKAYVSVVNNDDCVIYYENKLFELVTEKENALQNEKQPHKHRDLIIAWANGAAIQSKSRYMSEWLDVGYPMWEMNAEYRIKPEPKPDQSRTMFVELHPKLDNAYNKPNLKLTFDGETEKLKAVEIISYD